MKCLLILVLFFSIDLTFGQTSSQNCQEFLNGKFSYYPEIPGRFEIKNNLQIERYDQGGFVKAKIIWTGDCSYMLKVKKVTVKKSVFKKGDIVRMKILAIHENIITCEATLMNGGISKMQFRKE